MDNATLEMSDSNIHFSNSIKEVFREWTAIFSVLLIETREAGDLKEEIHLLLLAKQSIASIEGGIMIARVSKNEDELQDCPNSFRI